MYIVCIILRMDLLSIIELGYILASLIKEKLRGRGPFSISVTKRLMKQILLRVYTDPITNLDMESIVSVRMSFRVQ